MAPLEPSSGRIRLKKEHDSNNDLSKVICSFLLLDQKKRTKEKSSSLEGIILRIPLQKAATARSLNASLFVRYAAKRTNNIKIQNKKRICARPGKLRARNKMRAKKIIPLSVRPHAHSD
jgi:hypothetical protein